MNPDHDDPRIETATRTRAGRDAEKSSLPPPGTFPGYEVLREISRGGQGVIYHALQSTTKREVAVKVMLAGRFASPEARKRFQREITAIAQLRHPHIISIYHADLSGDEYPYYVMDYVRGQALDAYLMRAMPSVDELLILFARICRAVQYAHEHDVLHRDLKPSNILVDQDGAPRILDFGLAKRLHDTSETLITSENVALGTLPYMAPEQVRHDSSKIDERTDVYALGVILYRMLTGDYPYPVREPPTKVISHILNTPPKPPDMIWLHGPVAPASSHDVRNPIKRELRTIVLKALAKEPPRRYQTADEMADDIERCLAGKPIKARSDSVAYRVKMHSRGAVRKYPLAAYILVFWFAVLAAQWGVYQGLYRFTPLMEVYDNFMIDRLLEPDPRQFSDLRVVSFSDVAEMEKLAHENGLAGVTAEKLRSFRALHGLFMEKLALAKPRVVAWDVAFVAEGQYDDAFVRGVNALRETGVDVVVGTLDWSADESGLPAVSPNIRPHVRFGAMTVGTEKRWGLDLCLQRKVDGAVAPSLALATMAAARRPQTPATWVMEPEHNLLKVLYAASDDSSKYGHWMGESDLIQMTEVQHGYSGEPIAGIMPGDSIGMLTTPMPSNDRLQAATIAYEDVLRADSRQLGEWFDGKIVIAADARPGVDLHRHADGRWISGCYLHAVGVDLLSRGAMLHLPGPVHEGLLLYIGAGVGVVLAFCVRGPRSGLVILLATLVVAGASCIYAFCQLRILYNPSALLAAWFIALLSCLWIRRETLRNAAAV